MKRTNGFTILEILIATLLVGIGFFAIMEAFNRGVFGLGDVQDYTLALSLSSEKLEELQDRAFISTASEVKADVAGFTDFERQATVTSVHNDLKQVVVTTFWEVTNGQNSVTLTSYVVNN